MSAVPPAEADFVLTNSAWIASLRGPLPRTGGALRDLGQVRRGALAARQGRIVWVGPEAELEACVRPLPGARRLDAGGGAVLPGFVDAHTHLCFAGTRDDEIARRLAGATYAQIAAEGGGIVRTVSATRAASEDELVAGLLQRLDEALCCGTTTLEVKSGYGLETAAELRSLQAIRAAAARHPATIVPTFLGAHEVPVEHRADRARYLEILIDEMLPEVARQGLATFCDVFCEQGVFTVDESRRLLMEARDPTQLARATDLGTAMQLTNIARDVVEDAGMGRVYLPLNWLKEEGVLPEQVVALRYRPQVMRVVHRLLDEAERYYRSGDAGLRYLSFRPACAVLSARKVYSEIGNEVRRRGNGAWDERVWISSSSAAREPCT